MAAPYTALNRALQPLRNLVASRPVLARFRSISDAILPAGIATFRLMSVDMR